MAYVVKWVPAVFFTKGREDKVRRIVLHWMATTLAGCDRTFQAGVREASAHYGLEDDKRHQYVKESDTAWHSGVRAINHESIGVEHSAQAGRDASEGTIANSIALCTDLCRRYGLTADDIDVHKDFYTTQCPGTLPVARIRAGVRANLTNSTPSEEDELMAITVKNPTTGEQWPLETALWSLWTYAIQAARDSAAALAVAKAVAAKGEPLTKEETEQAVLDALGSEYDAKVVLTPKPEEV